MAKIPEEKMGMAERKQAFIWDKLSAKSKRKQTFIWENIWEKTNAS